MPVQIHGKSYKTVVERVNEFRSIEKYENWAIETEILKFEDPDCIIQARILDGIGQLKATGLAHEVRDSTNINKTSHVENCETSAIGRALAALGLAGTEYASGDEVSNAIINQHVKEATGKLSDLIQALLRHHDSVVAIKAGIASGEFSGASEEWFSLDEETKQALWVAPTKGGVFTTQEIEVIKSQEFRVSFYGTDTES
jgi:hypothetical protein